MHLLEPMIDAALIAARGKARPGLLAFDTVNHRLAVLGKWHRLNEWENPRNASTLKALLRDARKAQSRQSMADRE